MRVLLHAGAVLFGDKQETGWGGLLRDRGPIIANAQFHEVHNVTYQLPFPTEVV